MDTPQIIFLHVGPDLTVPSMMVRSIRAHNDRARIFQCSDQATPEIPGVDSVFRMSGDATKLMTFRLECFSGLALASPAIYLDTDMLIVQPLDPAGELQDFDVAVCSREFNRHRLLNASVNGIDVSEYAGKTAGELYPYVACATITRTSEFWSDCLANLRQLDLKFHRWFGDQEAIRNVVRSGKYRVKLLPESIYACVPGQQPLSPGIPRIYHYKGPSLKKAMTDEAAKIGLGS